MTNVLNVEIDAKHAAHQILIDALLVFNHLFSMNINVLTHVQLEHSKLLTQKEEFLVKNVQKDVLLVFHLKSAKIVLTHSFYIKENVSINAQMQQLI